MVIVGHHAILDAKPRIATGELRVWGDVGEDRKDQLVWQLENCGKIGSGRLVPIY